MTDQEFRDDVEHLAILADFKQRHDVRMVQARRGEPFLSQPAHAHRIVGHPVPHDFDRHFAMQLEVGRMIDLAHATGGQMANDAKPAVHDLVSGEDMAGFR
jgi:hypothetical protein